jgi:uncharacterized protein YbbK (DUF523 family)
VSPPRGARLAHDPAARAALRSPSSADPWRVLVSGCLMGWPCGVEGTDYGLGGALPWMRGLSTLRLVPFCPEDVGLGTPRAMPDLHGGDGFAVLRGAASVRDPDGVDLTEGMLRGGRAMVAAALEARVDFAVLTDASAACGSQVLSLGSRLVEPRRHQQGVGVATALLLQAGVPVVAQRDHRTLDLLRRRADPHWPGDPDARDHHEHPWVRAHFGA